MTAVVLTLHTLIVLGLIGVVLLQRSEGGALGMGAGSGGGFMTGRGAANALTRTTSILAALFFATSLGLAIFAGGGESAEDAIEELTGEAAPDPNAPLSLETEDLLGTLGGEAENAAEAVADDVSGAVDGAAENASEAVEGAASAVEDALGGLATEAGETIDAAADAAAEAVTDAAAEISEETDDDNQ
ncbi:MAG: preprotein translocase subunit SecG [Pseudomonadota bacterium]